MFFNISYQMKKVALPLAEGSKNVLLYFIKLGEKVLIKNRTLTCLDKSDNSIDVLFMIYTNCQSYYNFWQIALACVF